MKFKRSFGDFEKTTTIEINYNWSFVVDKNVFFYDGLAIFLIIFFKLNFSGRLVAR